MQQPAPGKDGIEEPAIDEDSEDDGTNMNVVPIDDNERGGKDNSHTANTGEGVKHALDLQVADPASVNILTDHDNSNVASNVGSAQDTSLAFASIVKADGT